MRARLAAPVLLLGLAGCAMLEPEVEGPPPTALGSVSAPAPGRELPPPGGFAPDTAPEAPERPGGPGADALAEAPAAAAIAPTDYAPEAAPLPPESGVTAAPAPVETPLAVAEPERIGGPVGGMPPAPVEPEPLPAEPEPLPAALPESLPESPEEPDPAIPPTAFAPAGAPLPPVSPALKEPDLAAAPVPEAPAAQPEPESEPEPLSEPAPLPAALPPRPGPVGGRPPDRVTPDPSTAEVVRLPVEFMPPADIGGLLFTLSAQPGAVVSTLGGLVRIDVPGPRQRCLFSTPQEYLHPFFICIDEELRDGTVVSTFRAGLDQNRAGEIEAFRDYLANLTGARPAE